VILTIKDRRHAARDRLKGARASAKCTLYSSRSPGIRLHGIPMSTGRLHRTATGCISHHHVSTSFSCRGESIRRRPIGYAAGWRIGVHCAHLRDASDPPISSRFRPAGWSGWRSAPRYGLTVSSAVVEQVPSRFEAKCRRRAFFGDSRGGNPYGHHSRREGREDPARYKRARPILTRRKDYRATRRHIGGFIALSATAARRLMAAVRRRPTDAVETQSRARDLGAPRLAPSAVVMVIIGTSPLYCVCARAVNTHAVSNDGVCYRAAVLGVRSLNPFWWSVRQRYG